MKHKRPTNVRFVNRRSAGAPRLDGGASGRVELAMLKPLRVLVAGEVILDRYIMGDRRACLARGADPDFASRRIEERPGNAGFVMANLRALRARVSALSLVGADPTANCCARCLAISVSTRTQSWSTLTARRSSRSGVGAAS